MWLERDLWSSSFEVQQPLSRMANEENPTRCVFANSFGMVQVCLCSPHFRLRPTGQVRTVAKLPRGAPLRAPRWPDAASHRLARLSRTLAATHKARILGGQALLRRWAWVNFAGTAPTSAWLEPDLEATLKGTDFVVIGHGMSGEWRRAASMKEKSKTPNLMSGNPAGRHE